MKHCLSVQDYIHFQTKMNFGQISSNVNVSFNRTDVKPSKLITEKREVFMTWKGGPNYLKFSWKKKIALTSFLAISPWDISYSNIFGHELYINVLNLACENHSLGLCFNSQMIRLNIFLSIFSNKFVVKCAAKILEIRLTNKYFMLKTILNMVLHGQGI